LYKDFEEFMALYIKLYLDPELPVTMKPHPVKKGAPLESGNNAPKINKGVSVRQARILRL